MEDLCDHRSSLETDYEALFVNVPPTQQDRSRLSSLICMHLLEFHFETRGQNEECHCRHAS